MNGVLERPIKNKSIENIKGVLSSSSLASESSYITASEGEKEDFMEDPINPSVMSDIGSTKIKVVSDIFCLFLSLYLKNVKKKVVIDNRFH